MYSRILLTLLGAAILTFAAGPSAFAQGCVAVRCNTLSFGASGGASSFLDEGDWQLSLAHRWFKSDRHFIDDSEQEERQEEGTEVINDVHTVDLSLTHAFTKRFSVGFTLPFISARRSSLYEHDRTNRHTMSAQGLGDNRLVGTYWLFSPDAFTNGNVALGLGIKVPTGDYKVADYRHLSTGKELRYVDNSIQPGDGGWGMILEFQAFQKIFDRTYLYANGTYMIQPQNTNDIGNSIWDSYTARVGATYVLWPKFNLSFSLGGRIEGVPPTDAMGESEGRRRPGYVISVEPGIAWSYKRYTMNLTTPVSAYRYRQNNYLGRPGDTAFADFMVLSSISYRF